MKYLAIFILQLLPYALFAQDFNSIRKPVSLNSVSVKIADTPIAIKEPDSVKTNFSELETTELPVNAHLEKQPEFHQEKLAIDFSKPLNSLRKTSGYGHRFHPILRKWLFHSGVDLASNADTVYSILSGKIKESGYSKTLGYYVRTEHSNGAIEVLYAHLSEYHYLAGEPISAGQPIGITGSTGRSTGDHLHLAVYKNGKHTNPIAFMSDILRFNKHITTYNNEQEYKRESDFGLDRNSPTGFASYNN